ncbi:MAG: chemotaxis protein CheW [Deltaproteobacteria bacterium]
MSEDKIFFSTDDCWHRIGVWGKETPRCKRLDDFIHCQNCDTFHAASLKAYERAIADDYRLEWTKVLAGNKETALSHTISVIIFRLGDEWVAIATRLCKEISRIMKIHRLPHNKSRIMRGVVSNVGEIQICFSLGSLLGIDKADRLFGGGENPVYARMIVMEVASRRYVFPVSEVGGLHHYTEADLGPLPKTVSDSSASYMKGVIKWNDKTVGCLDETLLTSQFERSIK